MKKHLSSILFGVLGLCAGMAICCIYFVLPQQNIAGRQPPATILVGHAAPATRVKDRGDAVALTKELNTLLHWPGNSWQQPESATQPSDWGKNPVVFGRLGAEGWREAENGGSPWFGPSSVNCNMFVAGL
jgi:hypothetical protein